MWAACRLYNSLDPHVIGLQFWADTGSDCTVFPLASWPRHWQIKEVPPVNGVGGQSRAWKSTQLVAITLHTKGGPEKTVAVYPYILQNSPPLLGRDVLAMLGVRITNL